MTLSQIKQLLAERQIQLTKSLGQNFLHDGNQLRRIVACADLGPADKVLEIGPGLGPLTELLLASAGEVRAIEKDVRLIAVLRERFAGATNLKLEHGDALEVLRSAPADWSDWKLVANLPYSVASPILVELATAAKSPARLVATLQLEVARRLMAGPGSSDYGLLTLLVQLGFIPEQSFKIPATCFFPPPEVDSACVCLVRRPEPLLSPAEAKVYTKVVKRGFSQRRKMMLKLLRQDWPGETLEKACAKLNIPVQARAETIDLDTFVQLARELHAAT